VPNSNTNASGDNRRCLPVAIPVAPLSTDGSCEFCFVYTFLSCQFFGRIIPGTRFLIHPGTRILCRVLKRKKHIIEKMLKKFEGKYLHFVSNPTANHFLSCNILMLLYCRFQRQNRPRSSPTKLFIFLKTKLVSRENWQHYTFQRFPVHILNVSLRNFLQQWPVDRAVTSTQSLLSVRIVHRVIIRSGTRSSTILGPPCPTFFFTGLRHHTLVLDSSIAPSE
jgi:hypothetical protein